MVKNMALNAGDIKDPWVNPSVGKIPWRRKWQPTVFLAGEFHERRSLGKVESMGSQRVRHD